MSHNRGTLNDHVPVHWRNSLIFRVILLCGLLLTFLLAMVYVLSHYFFHEIRQQMETQTRHITDSIRFDVEANPSANVDDLEKAARKYAREGWDVHVEESSDASLPNQYTLELPGGGKVSKIVRQVIPWKSTAPGQKDRQLMVTASVEIDLQTELVSAFKNKYLLLLTLGFLLTLALMVFFIGRILRPLGELSETCAQISAGQLRNVDIRKSSGEVQALERTFNRMVASLRDKEIVEANLRQAQRLSAIGNLAAGIAHDIRNPLNAIKLLSSHTIDQLQGLPEAATVARHVQTIQTEVNRLEEIVSGFLSLAKERDLQLEAVRIDRVLDECVRLMQSDADARDIRLAAELRAGDTELQLDAKQWTRAMLNILINAMEACPKGGRVRLFSRLTENDCEIEIRDDGPGMTKEAAEHAFDPYFTTKVTGTGLGLSITRGIIEEHGGAIQISGTDGHGCQVLIRLPLEKRVS